MMRITETENSEEWIKKITDELDIQFNFPQNTNGTGVKDDELVSGSSYLQTSISRGAVTYKQWEGTIVTIEDDNLFLARVQDIGSHDLPKLIRFDRRKVEFENFSLFAEGASFYWKVGLFYNRQGTAIKKSEIRFRLLPPPNPLLLKVAEEEMNRIFDMLSWTD